MAYFPLFIDIENQNVLVVGGGIVAERRVDTLASFGCRITVVSPEITDGIRERWEKGSITVYLVDFSTFLSQRGKEEAFWMVLAAAGDRSVNQAAEAFGRGQGALVNRADRKEASDFYFPGIAKKGPLVIGVTASGEDHRLARLATEAVRHLIDKDLREF